MHTVMTTNNAYDTILLVDNADAVRGAWTATGEVMSRYLSEGGDAEEWSQTDCAHHLIEDYGTECGRDGVIDDDGRREFWLAIL